jgi:hypothetical protein
MNRTNLSYKIALTVLLALCFALLLSTIAYYKEARILNAALAVARTKIEVDSITIAAYQLSDNKLRSVFAKYSSDSQGADVLLHLDTLLAAYVARNTALSLQTEVDKKLLELFRSNMMTADHKIATLEKQKSEVEQENISLASDLWNKVRFSDSISADLVALRYQLEKTDFDSLTLLSPKGNKIFYYGKLFNGLPHSFGIGFYQGRGYYIGEWKGNVREGWGKHFYKDGSVYEGNFENDLRAGFGIYYYASGEVYKGYWKDDLMNGEGEIIDADKKAITGIWENGKLRQRK